MAMETFTIEGDVNVQITITEMGDGTLKFDIQVLDDTGSIGDLNALYFDLFDDSLTDGLIATGDDITGTAFKVDGVTKVDNYTNMNGEVVKDLGKFDGGIQFGTAGMAEDDIQFTSFTLSHETESLSLSDFSLQDFGVRLTSVGEIDGSRDGSLKLGDTAPEFFPDVTDPGPDPDPVSVANDDTMTVFETEDFNPIFPDGSIVTDTLDFGATSLLDNDTTDGGAYTGDVTAANGDPFAVGQIVLGSDGGAIIIYPDGSVDFSAWSDPMTNDFGDLNAGESRTTTFTYEIENGDTATLTVTVDGVDGDPLGGGGPGGPGDPDGPTIIVEENL